jgi:hypothetical protein
MAVAPGARRLPINLKPAALRRVLFLEEAIVDRDKRVIAVLRISG